MAFKLSTQQEAIVSAVADNKRDIQVIARAGCGKTTTILSACNVASGRVAFFAFNKSIANELKEKAPSKVNVQTLHALGFAAVRYAFKSVQVDADKTYNLILSYIRPDDDREIIGFVKRLVGLAKNNLTDPTEENLWDLCGEYDVPVNGEASRVFEITRAVLRDSVPAKNAGNVVIDFDDMIWLPAVLGLNTLRFDWVFVDEAQDMNAAQQALVLKAAGNAGRVCYVGDPMQAIYKFRGADADAMNRMRESLEAGGREVVTLKLTKTRRCPKKVVALASEIVKDFECFPEAPEGEVKDAKEATPEPGDMVLCRLNRPLVPLAYRLLRAGIPVKIQGRDIGAGLISLVKKLKASDIEELLDKVEAYKERESAKIDARYKDKPSKLEAALEALEDKTETLSAIAMENATVEGVIDSINRLFAQASNARDMVLLSTVHRAKGLEAPTVWILDTPQRPGGQEENIRYVAITRAKNTLVFVPTE